MNAKIAKKLRQEVRAEHDRLLMLRPKWFPKWFWKWILKRALLRHK